jgi:hypothetical protein
MMFESNIDNSGFIAFISRRHICKGTIVVITGPAFISIA